MSHRILVTGASGYLGGTLLARWADAKLPPYDALFALVRNEKQASAVQQYGAQPLIFDVQDEAAVLRAVVTNGITIVYFLIDAIHSQSQQFFIKALGEVKKATGNEVHFLHTSGAKIFSSHAGAPTGRPLLDTDPDLYQIQKSQVAPHAMLKEAVETNCITIEMAEQYGVRSYIFVPCIVYGKGEGFGNTISIQTVCVVKAAKGVRRVYKVDEGRPTWPVCHILDNTTFYQELLRKILADENPGYGKTGYYLASSGSVTWDDLYGAMAAALTKHKVVDDDTVVLASDENLESMAAPLGVSKEAVGVSLGGLCTFTAEHGKQIGWKPQFQAEHILETAQEEVDLILQNLS